MTQEEINIWLKYKSADVATDAFIEWLAVSSKRWKELRISPKPKSRLFELDRLADGSIVISLSGTFVVTSISGLVNIDPFLLEENLEKEKAYTACKSAIHFYITSFQKTIGNKEMVSLMKILQKLEFGFYDFEVSIGRRKELSEKEKQAIADNLMKKFMS